MPSKIHVGLFDLGSGPGHHYYTGQFSRALKNCENLHLSLVVHAEQNLDYYNYDAKLQLRPPASRQDIWQLLKFWQQRNQIRDFLKDSSVDLVHIVFPHPWMRLPGIFADIPRVATVHDPELHPGESGFLAQRLLDYQLDQCHWQFCLGDSQRQKLCALRPKSQTHSAMPHGHFNELFEVEDSLGPDVLVFGRPSKYKGLELLLQAWQATAEALPSSRLHLLGAGVTQFIPKDCSLNRVNIVDRVVSDTELRDYVARSCVVVAPYIQSNASGVVATAQAFGRALIVSDLSSFREQVDPSTAVFFPPGDTKALTEALIDCCQNIELCADRGRRGRETAAKRQSWQSIAETCLHAYQEVLA